MPEDDLKSLLEKNLALTEELRHEVKKITRYIWWGRVMGTLKFLLVIGAFAGAYYVIQPYLVELLSTYQQLLGGEPAAGVTPQQLLQQPDEIVRNPQPFLKNIEELKKLLTR